MRRIDAELQARLDGGATELCRCWRIDRSDGTVLGFTDHDVDLVFDGLTFRASSGLDASALRSATGLSVDNAEAVGALSSAAITEADIRAGRFDGAEVRQWLVDWRRPDLRVMLFKGSFGEIRRADGRFEVELRGLSEAMNLPRGRNLLRRCDAELGDSRCGVDTSRAGLSVEVAVLAGSKGSRMLFDAFGGVDADWFTGGQLTWLTGENRGSHHRIKDESDGGGGRRLLRLWNEPSVAVSAGDRARLVAGCDGRTSSCRRKFDNFLNFRGFPHIPGEDWVIAYPKDGEVHDGGSRH